LAAAVDGLASAASTAASEPPDVAATAAAAVDQREPAVDIAALVASFSTMLGREATLEAVPSHPAAVALGHAASPFAIPPPYVGRDLERFHGLLIDLIHDSMHEGSLADVVDWVLGHPRKLLAGFAARHCPRCGSGLMSKPQLAQFLAKHFAGVVCEELFPQCNASSA
jgi:hypothetical protein